MKERMPFTLDMDVLQSEARRAGMTLSRWQEHYPCGIPDSVINLNMDVSDYVHPISVASQLMLLIQKELNTNDVVLVAYDTFSLERGISRISVIVMPTYKEQLNAS